MGWTLGPISGHDVTRAGQTCSIPIRVNVGDRNLKSTLNRPLKRSERISFLVSISVHTNTHTHIYIYYISSFNVFSWEKKQLSICYIWFSWGSFSGYPGFATLPAALAQQLGSLRGRGVSNQVEKHDKLGMVGFWGRLCLYIWVMGLLIFDSLLRVDGLLNISHGFLFGQEWGKHLNKSRNQEEGWLRIFSPLYIKLELLVSAADLSSGYCVNGVERHSSFPFVQDVIGYKLEPSCASPKWRLSFGDTKCTKERDPPAIS